MFNTTELVARIETLDREVAILRQIAHDLVISDGVFYDNEGEASCFACHADAPWDGTWPQIPHTADCLVMRARAAIGMEGGGDVTAR